jgi:acyl-CoA dehydrogenase
MRSPFDTEERNAFRETIRNFVANEIMPFASEWDEAGEVPWALHEKIGALGVWGFAIDEELGGLGFDDCFMRAAYAEELGRCGAGGVSAALNGRVISIEPINRLASPEIRARVLPEIISGRKGSSLGITEPGGGSDVANMQTTARRDGNHFVLDGTKTFITGGMKSDYFVIGARTGGEGWRGSRCSSSKLTRRDSAARKSAGRWAGGARTQQRCISTTAVSRQKT